MLSHSKNAFAVLGILLLGALGFGQDSQPILNKVIADWEARQKSTPAVQYEVSGKVTHVKGCFTKSHREIGLLPADFTGESPPKDHVSPKQAKYLFEFSKNWVRREISEEMFFASPESPTGGFFAPNFQTALYDGQELRILAPREKNTSETYQPGPLQPDVQIPLQKQKQITFSSFDLPIFLAQGIIPVPGHWMSPNPLLRPIDRDAFHVSGSAFVAGAECVLLKATSPKRRSYYELYVDTSKQSAVTRFRCVLVDRPFYQVDVRYRQMENVWLPSEWTVAYYSKDDGHTLTLQEDARVKKTDLNPVRNKEDFQFRPTAGMVVRNVPEKKTYRVDENGKLVQILGAQPFARHGVNAMWVVLCCALVITGLWFYVWRKRVRT